MITSHQETQRRRKKREGYNQYSMSCCIGLKYPQMDLSHTRHLDFYGKLWSLIHGCSASRACHLLPHIQLTSHIDYKHSKTRFTW